ncbi:MAG: hypothetical protein WB992_14185 [Bryobacteraceae bacterium]
MFPKIRRKLAFPATPKLRIAQVTAALRLLEAAESFPPDRWSELENYRPQVLAGSAADLQQLAAGVRLGAIDLSSVDHAVFMFTQWRDGPMDDAFRVVLWQAFGVPVYEVLISPGGRVLASECEAYEGWHVEPHASFFVTDAELVWHAPGERGMRSGLTARIETEPCPCGQAGTRLVDLEAAGPRIVRSLAATA